MSRSEVYLLFGILFMIMFKVTAIDSWASITAALINIVAAIAYFVAAIRAKGEA